MLADANPAIINAYRWIHLIVDRGLPFAFVEAESVRSFTSLKPLSRNTLTKYMGKLHKKVIDQTNNKF